MRYKHIPGGLFPHFDCGFERRPYFAEPGGWLNVGCRVDEGAERVALELFSEEGWRLVAGELADTNELGQKYFKFSFTAPETGGEFRYRFVSEKGERSECYVCPLSRKLRLRPRHSRSGAGAWEAVYGTDTLEIGLKIELFPCIRLIFTNNLNVKIDETRTAPQPYGGKYEFRPEEGRICVYGGGRRLFAVDEEIELRAAGGRALELGFSLQLPGRAVYGLGEKYDRVNQAGLKPLNYVVEQYANQGDKSYFPVPFMFTDGGVSLLQRGFSRSQFALEADTVGETLTARVSCRCPEGDRLYEAVLNEGSPAELIRAYTDETGSPALPPDWAFGPWISSNGWNSQREAEEQLEKLAETSIPATVMVLEAWSDEETFYIWNDAEYEPREDGGAFRYEDFRFREDGRWPDPMAFVRKLERQGLKLVLWQIPVVKYERARHGRQLDLDERYAVENGLCLKNADGSPYRITEMWFGNSLMPDFANPQTRRWWFEKRRYLTEQLHVAGFKTDGGEFLFEPGAHSCDGRRGYELHNEYPLLYEGAYHDFMEETLGRGKGLTFSRAGFTGAQRYPAHWAGDQLSTFSELRGQLTAGLSLGLTGVPFWGFDIGGFAGDFPSTELYLRAAALAAFAPIMQFHSEPRYGQYYMTEREHWNNDRSPWNMAEANRDWRIIPIYRLFANLRMNLLPYILREARHISRTSRPLMAHLVYDFLETDGGAVLDIEDEYMFGRALLVAPITAEGERGREIYLPRGRWLDLWTGEPFEGGRRITRECGLDRIPVFVRHGSVLPVNLNRAMCMGTTGVEGSVSGAVGEYENFCLLACGGWGEDEVDDAAAGRFRLRWSAGEPALEGEPKIPVSVFAMEQGLPCPRCGDRVEGSFFGRKRAGVRLGRTF